MNAKWIVIIAMAVTVVSVSLSAYPAWTQVEAEAAQKAVEKALKTMDSYSGPANARIGVFPFKNDSDGEVYDLFTAAMQRQTSFTVVLRDELETVVRSAGFTMEIEDLFNPETIKQLGGFVDVDLLLFGDVREIKLENSLPGIERSPMVATVRLSCKLADVDTGEVVWAAASVTGSAAEPPLPKSKTGLVVLVVALLVAVALVFYLQNAAKKMARQRQSVKEQQTETDATVRNGIVRDLTASIECIREARHAAGKSGNIDISDELRNREHEIDMLRTKIDEAQFRPTPGNLGGKVRAGTETLDALVDFESSMRDFTAAVKSGARRIAEDVEAGRSAESDVKDMKTDVRKLRERFDRRQDILDG